MAAWFGHTQTLTSISKSVSTVASGILGLEANLATFIQKVTYYDKFFQRVGANLPPEVVKTAALLFARCYEYRDEIRDELESSLAYVADAGRWVIGMEDWNSKMEKRLAQISELVLLTNTLLAEYALTGKWGAQGEKDGLGAYLQTIASSVVLHNPEHHVKLRRGDRPPHKASESVQSNENPLFPQASTVEDDEEDSALFPRAKKGGSEGGVASENPLSPLPATSTPASDSTADDNESELFLARSSAGSANATSEEGTGELSSETPADSANADDDDDALNPFARAYQPPMSMESSLASLRGESDSGSVYFNAVDAQQQSILTERDVDCEEGDEPDSPVSLGEYECLDIESIPKYVAFKPSVLSRKRRLKQQYTQFFGGSSSSPSSSSESLQPTPVPLATPPRVSPSVSPRATSTRKHVISGANSVTSQTTRQKLMDLTYSYDFQQEMTFNPFASPSLNSDNSAEDVPPALQLSMRQTVPTVVEEVEHPITPVEEQTYGHERHSPEENELFPPPISTVEAEETRVDDIIHLAAHAEAINVLNGVPGVENEADATSDADDTLEAHVGFHSRTETSKIDHFEVTLATQDTVGASVIGSTSRRNSRDEGSELFPSLGSPPSPTPAASAEEQGEFSRILDLLTPDDDAFASTPSRSLS